MGKTDMRYFVRIAAIAAFLLPAAAQAQSTFGMAGVQCVQFMRAARSGDMLYHQASQWLLGYVSGMNAARGTTATVRLTNDQVLKSAGDFCEANPSSNLANAANQWYASLPKQADPQAAAVAAEAQPESKGSGSLILNLDNAPKNKPLLDRR